MKTFNLQPSTFNLQPSTFNFKIALKTVLLLIICFLANKALTQTYLKKEWVAQAGITDSIKHRVAKTDALGNLIVADNIKHVNEAENICITKFDRYGNIIWQQQINGSANLSDFGTDLIVANDNSIYACGAKLNLLNGYDMYIAKYYENGTLAWETDIDNNLKNDIPVSLFLMNNKLYVCGSTAIGITNVDFSIYALNTNNGNIIWNYFYDYNGYYDIPAKIIAKANTVYVTGASGTSLVNWEIATLKLDTNGLFVDENRIANTTFAMNKPIDFCKDLNNNIYIVGRYKHATENNNIALIKYNQNFNLEWTRFYDYQGLDDEPNSLTVDENNNILIAGYGIKANEGKNALLLKYNSAGTLLYEFSANFSRTHQDDEIKIAITNNNEIIAAGQYFKDNNKHLFISTFNDTLGLTKFDDFYTDHEVAYNAFNKYNSNAYYLNFVENVNINGVNTLNAKTSLLSSFKRNNALYIDASGKPLFKNTELIIRFASTAVNKTAIDNAGKPYEKPFAKIEEFIRPSLADSIKNTLRQQDIVLVKIFPYDKSTDTLSIGRAGQQVRIPEFYCTFLACFKDTGSIMQYIQDLKPLFPHVVYTEPNFVIENENAELIANPVSFNQADCIDLIDQPYLNNTVGINIMPAWELERGKQHVRVAIMDDGVMWRHFDFRKEPDYTQSLISWNDTSKSYIQGWNFITNSNIKFGNGSTTFDLGEHGTPVTGLICANSGNLLGMNGIAGGCSEGYSTNPKPYNGVKPFVFNVDNNFLTSTHIDYFVQAFRYSSQQSDSSNINDPFAHIYYGVHLQNTCYYFRPGNTPGFFEQNLNLLREAVYFSNRNGVSLFSSRGNNGNKAVQYPACFDTTLVMAIGGSGINGAYLSPSSYGKEVDVIAPYHPSMIKTIGGPQEHDGNYMKNFGGTSASTPMVTGVAALLMSYLNDTLNNGFSIHPEDVHQIITKTATDVNDFGQDTLSGYGRLNAGEALNLVNKNNRRLVHLPIQTNINALTVTDSLKQIYLKYKTYTGTTYLDTGWHLVRIKSAEFNFNVDLDSSESVKDFWPIHSVSNVYDYPTNDTLNPIEKLKIISVNSDTTLITCQGYFFEFLNSNNITAYTYLPIYYQNLKAELSVLIEHPPLNLSYKESDTNAVVCYPNPANEKVTIKSNNSYIKSIAVYDVYGKEHFFVNNLKQAECSVNLLNFSNGAYIIKTVLENGQIINHKLIKY